MPKPTFLVGCSGTRFVRLSSVKEFRVTETGIPSLPAQVAVYVNGTPPDWLCVFKGTVEECQGWVRNHVATRR